MLDNLQLYRPLGLEVSERAEAMGRVLEMFWAGSSTAITAHHITSCENSPNALRNKNLSFLTVPNRLSGL